MSIHRERFTPTAAGAALVVDGRREGAAYVVRVAGELDLATATALRDELHRAELTDAARIVLDLSSLDFIDASGVQVVLEADARSRVDGGRLRIVRGPEHLHRVLVMVGVADRLPFGA
jgi:anti-sigma B factor antagonist